MTPQQQQAIASARHKLDIARDGQLSTDPTFWVGWLDETLVILLRDLGEDIPQTWELPAPPGPVPLPPLPQPPPTCLTCGAPGDLVSSHTAARTGIAARDVWYCHDLTKCSDRRHNVAAAAS